VVVHRGRRKTEIIPMLRKVGRETVIFDGKRRGVGGGKLIWVHRGWGGGPNWVFSWGGEKPTSVAMVQSPFLKVS